MNLNSNPNYLTNSLTAAGKFLSDAAQELRGGLYTSKYGYGSNLGNIVNTVQAAVKEPAKAAATAVADVLTNKTLGSVWKYTNVPRMAGELGKTISQKAGVDPVTGAVLTAAAPVALMSLSGVRGPLSQGLRPAGYKAVAPKSKEEDPTGKTPQSIPLEIGLRYGLGQRSQLLSYQDFKEERPDVAPSTYSQYRRYQQAKPKPGQLVAIDPEGQSFTTIGGLLRGTAKGLNDPEIRVKGFPVTASGLLGTVAGLGTATAAYKALPQDVKEARIMKGVDYSPGTVAERAALETKLEPIEKRLLQTKQIVNRVEGEMKSKGVRTLEQYGPDPSDQASLLVHRQALQTRTQLRKIDNALPKYEYALGRAKGEIPKIMDDPGVEAMMAAPAEQGGMGVKRTKTERHAAESYKRQVVHKLEPPISFSDSTENINYLEGKIAGLKQRRESLISGAKEKLNLLNIPEEHMVLQERLSRAKRKTGELSTAASELQGELRSTYRPTSITAPSTATIAGLAVAGTAAAIGTAYAAKKLFQRAAERRVKKEDPIEYLKHKHGSFQEAAQALGQPGAQNWQQLTPYVK
jgi:hypothetical protein